MFTLHDYILCSARIIDSILYYIINKSLTSFFRTIDYKYNTSILCVLILNDPKS